MERKAKLGFRFYRRINILPGVSLNLGKSGASVSVGPRGAKMTVGPRGVKSSVGIPGTGMRYETPYRKLSSPAESTPDSTGRKGAACLALVVFAVVFFILRQCCQQIHGGIGASEFNAMATIAGVVAGLSLVALLFVLLSSLKVKTKYSSVTYSKKVSKAPMEKALSPDVDSYLRNVKKSVEDFYSFIHALNCNPRCREMIKSFPGMDNVTGDAFTVTAKLGLMVYCDVRDCYAALGHDKSNLKGISGIGYSMMVMCLINKKHDLERFFDPLQRDKLLEIFSEFSRTDHNNINIEGHDEEFRFAFLFGTVKGESDWAQRYLTLMYRWASLIAKADGKITSDESSTLAAIVKMQKDAGGSSGNVRVKSAQSLSGLQPIKAMPDERPCGAGDKVDGLLESAMTGLNELVGLAPVKDEVEKLASFIKIQKERQAKGMKLAPVSYHCIFTGNPGTGKTTVARILADIFKGLGVLKKGQLVETDRSGLIGEYVGHTAVKTNKVIDSAIDGVLFIDEAYSLIQGGDHDYGPEAIATLLKRMEDDRDRLIVVLAGYTEEMKAFIESNPGLHSRFNRYVTFPDYSAEELAEIFLRMAKKSEYTCDNDVQNSIADIMKRAIATKDKTFGNARYVRNLFERAIERQAVRLSTESNLTTERLSELTLHDLGFAYE